MRLFKIHIYFQMNREKKKFQNFMLTIIWTESERFVILILSIALYLFLTLTFGLKYSTYLILLPLLLFRWSFVSAVFSNSLSVFLFSSHLVALIRPTIRSNGIDIESMESMCAYFIAFLFFLANLFFFLVGFFSRKINLNAIAAIIDLVYAMCAFIGMFSVVVVYCCSVFLHRYAWIVMILFGWQRKVDHLISTIQSRRCARKYYFACSSLYSSISSLNNWLTEWTLDKHTK